MMMRRKSQLGDTLIEVVLAITIFSAGAVAAVVIMNNGITNAQRSLEITLVRNQINNQAELLRHLNNVALVSSGRLFAADAASGSATSGVQNEWAKIKDLAVPVAQNYDEIQTTEDCSPDKINIPGTKVFFIDPKTGKVQAINTTVPQNFKKESPFAKVTGSDADTGAAATSDMIWIYAVQAGGGEGRGKLTNTNFYDFHIRACWDAPDGANVQKLGTIVRLYEPN